MVIRIRLEADTNAIEGQIAFLEAQNEIVDEILENVVEALAPTALAALRRVPPVKRFPIGEFPWTSRKQQIAVIIKLRKANNLPSRRSGKLAAAWIMEVRDKSIVIENPSRIAKYVYGSLAQDRTAALRFQQRFHAIIGWQPATDTAAEFLDASDKLFRNKYDEKVGEVGRATTKRRAFTSGTRRR